jgi:hypothetical protein
MSPWSLGGASACGNWVNEWTFVMFINKKKKRGLCVCVFWFAGFLGYEVFRLCFFLSAEGRVW